MDYKGEDYNQSADDPQTAINTAAIISLQKQLDLLLQFCRIEAVPILPVSRLQESNPIEQAVILTGNNPDLYNEGYVTCKQVKTTSCSKSGKLHS